MSRNADSVIPDHKPMALKHCFPLMLDMMEPELSSPTSLATSLRFRFASVVIPGQWHHLTVVLTKDIKKSCVASVYLNGKAVGTGKVCIYPSFLLRG